MDDLPMWGMVGEVLRDDAHGRMEKVRVMYKLLLGYVFIYFCFLDPHSIYSRIAV